jgi:hypothetical protein
MKFAFKFCALLSFLWQPLIFAIEFVDNCNHLGGPIFSEKDGWARIGCKTDDHFGYCTLTRNNPHLTCKIKITNSYNPEITDCPERARIRFTGSAVKYFCKFFIENLQSEGNTLSYVNKYPVF